ncbi:hypothetical protein BGZ63DRAFT_448074 [Mariannaea sp. PMI_226]|nr:hypothetical protein BGZ63DRAFT_448074 [Mariannaea sp. PMI_226]
MVTLEVEENNSIVEASRHLEKLEKDDVGWQNRETARQASNLAALQLSHPEETGSDKVISLYERLLSSHKRNQAVDKLETVRCQYNLAFAHDACGRIKEAEAEYCSALNMIQEQLKKQKSDFMLLALHINTLDSLGCTVKMAM